jgi:hypothetical protein
MLIVMIQHGTEWSVWTRQLAPGASELPHVVLVIHPAPSAATP